MSYVQPGTIVAVSVGPTTHMGIATERGTFIANSKKWGCVREQGQEEFSGGQPVRSVGYWGKLTPADVLDRARSLVGKRYDVVDFNCEHFVRLVHGLPLASPQIRAVLLLLLVGTVVVLWNR